MADELNDLINKLLSSVGESATDPFKDVALSSPQVFAMRAFMLMTMQAHFDAEVQSAYNAGKTDAAFDGLAARTRFANCMAEFRLVDTLLAKAEKYSKESGTRKCFIAFKQSEIDSFLKYFKAIADSNELKIFEGDSEPIKALINDYSQKLAELQEIFMRASVEMPPDGIKTEPISGKNPSRGVGDDISVPNIFVKPGTKN